MKVTKKCFFTGKTNTVDLNITERQLKSFQKGEGSAEQIFPHLTSDEQEFLKTGFFQNNSKRE
jgi:uncharacterized protein (DUF952 family)